jgi:hypothetical protein
MSNLEIHHKEFRSQAGDDSEENLITLCDAMLISTRAQKTVMDVALADQQPITTGLSKMTI